MKLLICGGAGYIGSHMVKRLLEKNIEPVVADNFATGHRQAVPEDVSLYQGDIRDGAFLDKIFRENKIEGVIHFAADSLVGESMKVPLKYFDNNVGGMQSLLEAMVKAEVDKLIFSSTAAVYGEPESIPIEEEDRKQPVNPYGESKLMMERMMRWVCLAHGLRYVALRYFNAAGAAADGTIGEAHPVETHLIPLILQTALGQRDHITIFGDDYPTQDGTCIRDYIHVTDLADAHLLAMKYLLDGRESAAFNLGNGTGFSVREMIEAAERVTGKPLKVELGQRRLGDPAQLVASGKNARRALGWRPEYTSVEAIIATAWRWHSAHPEGYER